MYNYCNDNVPDIFDGFFQRNSELHSRNTRQSNDFHVRFARLYVRKFSLRIHGVTIWNDIPLYIKHACSLNVFKQMPRKHLINMNVHMWVCDTIPIDVADYWMTVLSFSEEYYIQETSFSCATRIIGLEHLPHSWLPHQPLECHLVVTIVHYWPPGGIHLAGVMPMIALHIY